MDYLPLFFDLKGRRILVIGGGEIARRKVDLILQAGAAVTLIAPDIAPGLKALLSNPPHQLIERAFAADDISNDITLVICATDNAPVNTEVAKIANAQHVPVNVVDNVALSNVIFPAIVDRSPLIAAVASGGASPVLTRKIRTLLEQLIPQGYQNLARFLGQQRDKLKANFPDPDIRRRATEAFLQSPGESLAQQGEFEQATAYLDEASASKTGEVYVVGAGPGDPDLLTLKALQLMQQADIILYDNLVSEAILSRARRDATKEYVGKIGGDKSTDQETINEKLLRLAQAGHRVLRLKGGDPFVFGRGGEEIEGLIEAGIPFQVVPGITAANGCAAYAGIPLTHRDYSQSVRFVTGHPKDGEVMLAWQEFAHKNQTIVFYMGLGGLEVICERLIAHGRDATTPIAVVSKGTLPEQTVVTGNLSNIVEKVRSRSLQRPTLIIVGEVVNFRQKFIEKDRS